MAEELKISPAIIIPVGLGLALTAGGLGLIALYKHGVEVYLFEIPHQVKVDEPFSSTLGLINRSNIIRDGWVELFIDDIGFDVAHLTLEPSETWEQTYEGFSFHETGIHEFCWSIDTFNKDLVEWPWFLRPALSISRQIEVV